MTQTVTAFYGALNSLVVTGVRRRYAYEPNGLSTADLPAQWVRLPGAALGIDGGYASACNDTSKERTAELVIALEAAGQDTPGAATTALLTMIDALETALDALAYPLVEYTISGSEPIVTALTQYWGVTATVTIRG